MSYHGRNIWGQQPRRPVKEWMVEFIAMVNGEKHHHLSVLYGTDQEDVQRAMLHELRRIYTDTDRIDVTIVRLEEIESEEGKERFSKEFTFPNLWTHSQ